MGSPKETLAYTSQVTPQEAADYLESLARSLRDGLVLLESGDRAMTLEPGRAMQFDLEASGSPEKGKHRLEIAFSWRAAEQVRPQPTLAIVAGVSGSAITSDGD